MASKPALVHSLSMFQPSLIRSDQAPPTPAYKPPIFATSSCTSIHDKSRRSTRRPQRQISTRRSGRRSQFPSRSQSIGGLGGPPARQNSLTTHSSQEGGEQKGSLGSIVEKNTSIASISQHFSSLMSMSSQVRREDYNQASEKSINELGINGTKF